MKPTGRLNTSTGTVELCDGDANPSCGSCVSPAAACLFLWRQWWQQLDGSQRRGKCLLSLSKAASGEVDLKPNPQQCFIFEIH